MGYYSEMSSCEGKVAFSGRRHANGAANRKKGRIAYKCDHCHKFHVGTPFGTPRAKKSTKRNKLIRLFIETEEMEPA